MTNRTEHRSGSLRAAFLAGLLALAGTAAGAGGCEFQHRLPSGVVACQLDRDCPQGFLCEPRRSGDTIKVCCQGGACPGGGPATPPPPPPAAMDAGGTPVPREDPPAPPVDAGGVDAGGASADAGSDPAEAGSPGGGPPPADAGPAAMISTCTDPVDPPYVKQPDEETYCVISVRDSVVSLAVEVTKPGLPYPYRTHAICANWLELAAAAGPTSPGRTLPVALVDAVAATLEEYKRICDAHRAKTTWAVATSWASGAANLGELRTRVQERAKLELEVLGADQELTLRYLGLSGNRRRRIVLTRAEQPELLYWSRSAAAVKRHVLSVDPKRVGPNYLAHAQVFTFEDARRRLRANLFDGNAATLRELAGLVQRGELLPEVVLGPTDATLILAISGGLRSGGVWDSPGVQATKAKGAATLTTGGWTYGNVSHLAINSLFTSIDAEQFRQLRMPPLLDAYPGPMIWDAVMVDLLADEVNVLEFGTIFANFDGGYFLNKLNPTPQP